MSSSAIFWAAKSNDVKSPQAPTQVAEPTTARGTPEKKNGMVLKSTTNGVKKSNWADSDDEEEFLASFALSGRLKQLERIISASDGRITDLATAVQEKDGRITELESAYDEQKQRLTDLQSTLTASAAQVDELKEENHKQFLHVQKLVAGDAKKDRRIAALEAEVDEHCATIAELDVCDSSTQVSSHDIPQATNAAGTPDATSAKPEVQIRESKAQDQTAQDAEDTTKEAPTDVTIPANPAAKTIPSKATGPTVNLSAFPVFATAVTVKHIAPPPPAPKLKMPVDLSKFAKKSAAKVVPKKNVETGLGVVAQNDSAPKIDPTSDIRTKRLEDRALFANGPKVQVKMGDTVLSTLPKFVLMQCSNKAFKHFSDNPDAATFILPACSMEEAAAKAHLEWMKEMTYQGRVYSITLHSDEKFDDKNLQICRAARVLGLNNMYVGHFTKIFCDRIRSNTAPYEFLNKIAALAYPGNDPVYDCLANNLANLRTRNAVKNNAELKVFLKNHAGLKGKIEQIEERMRKKQERAKSAKSPKDGKNVKVIHVGRKLNM